MWTERNVTDSGGCVLEDVSWRMFHGGFVLRLPPFLQSNLLLSLGQRLSESLVPGERAGKDSGSLPKLAVLSVGIPHSRTIYRTPPPFTIR